MVGNERVVTGFYSYIGPDGKTYTVNYIADRNGYRASSSNSPVPNGAALQPLPQQGISAPRPVIVQSTPYPNPTISYPAPNRVYVPSSPAPYQPPVSYIPPTSTPFPIYSQSTPPWPGYNYNNVNQVYSGVTRNPAPIYYSTTTQRPYAFARSSENPRFVAQSPDEIAQRVSTISPPLLQDIPSSTFSPIDINTNNNYFPTQSAPRPFGNTVYITPKSFINQQGQPNSFSINQDLLPPHFSANEFGSEGTFGGRNVRPLATTISPQTVTNLSYRQSTYKK